MPSSLIGLRHMLFAFPSLIVWQVEALFCMAEPRRSQHVYKGEIKEEIDFFRVGPLSCRDSVLCVTFLMAFFLPEL